MPKIVIVDTDFENNDFEVRMAKDAGVDIALFNEREPEAITAMLPMPMVWLLPMVSFRPRCLRRFQICAW